MAVLNWRTARSVERRVLRMLFGVGTWSLVARGIRVGAFLLISGLHKAWPQPTQTGPSATSDDWTLLDTPREAPVQLTQSRVAITYHPWYHNFQVALVYKCLQELAALGAGYVRTDVRWMDVLPDGITPDERAIAWHRAYFRIARDWFGLRPLIVLSAPPPAVRNRGVLSSVSLDKWRTYTDLIGDRFADLCDLYQVLNEPNNPVYSMFAANQIPSAITSAAASIRKKAPKSLIAVNLLMDLWNWRRALNGILTSTDIVVDIIGFDHYPGTWTLSSTSDWNRFNAFAREVAAAGPDSSWRGKQLAIMETGYAANLPGLRTETHQADYYRGLADMLIALERQTDVHLSIIGLYELCDPHSLVPFDPESRFGLLTSTLTRKLAFHEVRALVERVG
jgi:hypothetical protein